MSASAEGDLQHGPDTEVTLAGFYHFTPVDDPAATAADLRARCQAAGLLGTVLLSGEGINGALAGERAAVHAVTEWLGQRGLSGRRVRFEQIDVLPFGKLIVRTRREIVTFDADVRVDAGQYVDARRFDELLADPAVRVLDVRNHYETRVGRFDTAEDPGTGSFREFRHWVRRELDPARDRCVAMYCTGGIRCEKAAAWMRSEGFSDVLQLDGGVLGYLADTQGGGRWQGDCFVFDRRVAVDAELKPADWQMCHGCRAPVSAADRQHPDYEAGVACPACASRLDPGRRARLRMRARQLG